MSLEKFVAIFSIALSFVVAGINPMPFIFIVPCFALILFGFLCFLEKTENDSAGQLDERMKRLEEKVSIHVAFGGKR